MALRDKDAEFPKGIRFIPPFQGLDRFAFLSQGVTPGCIIPAFQADRTLGIRPFNALDASHLLFAPSWEITPPDSLLRAISSVRSSGEFSGDA